MNSPIRDVFAVLHDQYHRDVDDSALLPEEIQERRKVRQKQLQSRIIRLP
jgi:hypothetical protein